jgi:uncharacterized protein with NRDE domain
MCTATWIRSLGTEAPGYEVFFNRDEHKTRKPALPPAVKEREGVRFLAPEDGDAGGTWLGVNEYGIAIGLANGPLSEREGGRSARDEGAGPFRSRGLLVLDLLSSASVEIVGARMGALRGRSYRSFELFAIEPIGGLRIWRWDGETLASGRDGPGGKLLISSSRDPERARREREALLERMVHAKGRIDAEVLLAYHASHEPERGAFSPCMHREDAGTVSFSRIRVGPGEVEFEYRQGPPCEGGRVYSPRLSRRTA